jgi:hypothetical protein
MVGFGQKGRVPPLYGDLEIKISTSVLLYYTKGSGLHHKFVPAILKVENIK